MAAFEHHDNAVWDRFFAFIAVDVEKMSASEIGTELQQAGIDPRFAFLRVKEALQARRAREMLKRAQVERPGGIGRLLAASFTPIDNVRKTLDEMIAKRVPQAQRPVYYNRLEKVATDADLQSLLEDLTHLHDLEAEGEDGQA